MKSEKNRVKAADLESLAVQKVLTTLAPYHLLVMEKNGDLVVTCSVLKKVKESLQTKIYATD